MATPDLSWRLLALLAIGGALGTIARHLVSSFVPVDTFPWGTWVVNFSGSVLLALFTFGAVAHGHVAPDLRVTVGIAFFGAYTTMSTFAVETVVLLERVSPGWAALNILLNPGSCVVGAGVGWLLANQLPAPA